MSYNTPSLRFKGYNDAWEQRKLRSLSENTFGGGTPKTNILEYWSGTIPWIQSSDLENNKLFNVLPKKYITENAVKNSATKIVPSSSIAIVTRVGVGKLAFMTYEYATSQDFLSLSNLNTDGNFSTYAIYKLLQKELNNIQGTSIKGITKIDLLEKNIVIPSALKEQEKIGSLFKQLDDTIALHQRKLDNLKRLKQGYLQQLFPKNDEKVPRIRFANFENEWELRKLEDIIISELKGKAKAEMYGTSSPYLETNYLNGGEVSYVDSPINVDKDDVIILWDGSQAGTVYHGFKGALGSTLKAYSPKESGEYLYQYLKLNQQVIYDSYRTPNIPHVIKTFTKEFNVHFTCYEEQDKVGSFLNQLDETIDLYQSKVDKLKLLKKGFLQKMFI